MKGKFITFEGIEGSGKTTVMHALAELLREKGQEVVETREPGGTDIGQELRKLLIDPKYKNIAPRCEFLLFMADREQHIKEVLKPALDAGKIVLCDRYLDSMIVYQSQKILKFELEEISSSIRALTPDLTFILDLPVDVAMSRIKKENRTEASKNDYESFDFHNRIRKGFIDLYWKDNSNRIEIIDSNRQVAEIVNDIINNDRFAKLIS